MNTRPIFLFSLALIWLVSQLEAQAHKEPAKSPLANFDVRSGKTNTAAARKSAAATSALELDNKVNGLRFQASDQDGSPRFLAAQRGFLTGPNGLGRGLNQAALNAVPQSASNRVLRAFINEHAAIIGHDSSLLDEAALKVNAVTKHSGMRTLVWQQQLDSIPVYGAMFVAHQTKNDELASLSSRFVQNLNRSAGSSQNRQQKINQSSISATKALQIAIENIDGSKSNEQVVNSSVATGPTKKQSLKSAALKDEGHVQLIWLPLQDENLTLCWQVILTSVTRPEMYLVLVDSESGDVLLRRCLTQYISPATYNVFTSDSPSPFSPGLSAPSPFQPPFTNRTLVTLTALNTNASPNGWINDGIYETRGNNVDAFLDRNDDDLPDLPRFSATNRIFDFPLDFSQSPLSHGSASTVNLFYWNNFCHDKLYELGFTEAFFNFQQTNFNRGGTDGDAVQANAQDGGGFNNANFATPPDGIPGRMQMYLFDGPSPDRDGSLDAEVMIHEYVHGLSNRLLGGGVGISELQTAGMGEGWSDFYALAFLSEPTDALEGTYAAGGYLTFDFSILDANYYFGIRRYPYSTDMTKNPLTLKDIDPTKAIAHTGIPLSPIFGGSPADEVHNMGEVWCVALWECRANLIEKHGFAVGNNLMLKLVTDGLKLAPANATFIEARDGVLLADEVLTGGDNLPELWTGFAKRGMGFSASVPSSDTTIGVQEAYDLPDYIIVGPPDGIFELRIIPASGNALVANTTNDIFLRVTDGSPVTNAAITATLSSGGSLSFRNDGVQPDVTANNAVYSARLVAPNITNDLVVTLIVSAPGKDTVTNFVAYSIVAPPPNDNFTNSIKVPAAGGTFVTLNKNATLETGEPKHAGIASSDASLWWNYTPSANGNVLIDTGGSAINTVLAVYTNNILTNLTVIAATNDVGSRPQAFVYINGKAGVTYRIAVASYDINNRGTIRLAVTPGGIPDTNAPSLTVSSPPSGLTLATNRIVLTGTAIDPNPSPSGLQDIELRVNRLSANGSFQRGDVAGSYTVSSLISSNWTRSIGLYEGLNQIEVAVKDVAGNRSTPVILQATYRPLDPANDFFVNAATLTGIAGTNNINTLKATKEINEPAHGGIPGGKSAWWKYQPPVNGRLTLVTTNSGFDTLLAVYQGSTVGNLIKLAENDDGVGLSGGASLVSLAVRSNQMYHIAMDGFDGAGGSAFLQHGLVPATVYNLSIVSGIGGSVNPGTMDVVAGDSVNLTAIPNSGMQFDIWTGSRVSLVNPLSVTVTNNMAIFANFRSAPNTDGFESGSFVTLPWTFSGSLPWIVQNTNKSSGNFAARSGAISSSQNSRLLLNAQFRSGVGTFDFRVSSELGWDFFSFYVDGVLQQQWSGDLGWNNFGFLIAAGNHTLEWRYAKDANNTGGLDAVFLDNVNLPIVIPIDASTPARLTARSQTDGLVFLDILGQTNQLYQIQTSTDLTSWQTVGSQVLSGGFSRVLLQEGMTNQMRFYRAVRQ